MGVVADLRVGALVDDVYRLEGLLGEGSAGIVALATHVTLGHRAALKLLRPGSDPSGLTAEAFLHEARLASRLQSVHIARIYHVGDLSGHPYIATEYLEGADLGAVIADEGRLPALLAMTYVLQACEALAEAHAAGIVHRDLKPSSLFLARSPDGSDVVKMLDFGVAKWTGQGATRALDTRRALGVAAYLAPEQLRAVPTADVRTDIWSLGAILFELLTGRRPFVAGTRAELCVEILTREVPPLQRFVRDVPPALASAVMRCLEKDATKRFASVAALAEALRLVAPSDAVPSIDRVVQISDTSQRRSSLEPSMVSLRAPTSLSTPAPKPSESLKPLSLSRPRHPAALRVSASLFVIVLAALAGATLAPLVTAAPPPPTTASTAEANVIETAAGADGAYVERHRL